MNRLIEMFEDTDGQELEYILYGNGFNIKLSTKRDIFRKILFQGIIYNHIEQKLLIFPNFLHEYNKTNYSKKQEFISYIENRFNIKILEVV